MNLAAKRLLARRILGRRKAQRGMPPLPQRGETNRFPISNDWAGIRAEIGRMKAMVLRGIGDPKVIMLARAIVQSCPQRNQQCELGAIFGTVNANMRFVEDPVNREAIATPEKMVRQLMRGLVLKDAKKLPMDAFVLSGDCDEHATLTTALAGAIGIPIAFGFGGSGGQAVVAGRVQPTFHHVWGEARVGGRWIALDTTGGKRLGEVWSFRDFGRLVIAGA